MSYLNKGDFVDLYHEVQRKGALHIFRKLVSTPNERIVQEWESIDISSSDWWTIPLIRRRWNKIISGSEETEFQEYVCTKYLSGKNNLRLLSVGSGGGTAEIKFAMQKCFALVEGFDLSQKIIDHAKEKLKQNNLPVNFFYANAANHNFGCELYDVILFNRSLHHFSSAGKILFKARTALRSDGFLILVEYVGPNRFQWKENQLKIINDLLEEIPTHYRRRQTGNSIKRKAFRPGTLRMYLNDPSESGHSEEIPQLVKNYFDVVEEKELGGNVLHPLLKDIAHNFNDSDSNAYTILEKLFAKEDEFLKTNDSDFLFGIYKKQQNEN